MCEPMTIIAATSTALAATQSVVSYMGASADAAAQDALYEQNKQNALAAYSDDIEANNLDTMARQEDATNQRLDTSAQALASRASARVAMGERGLGGFTAAAIEQDLGFQEGSSIANINRNSELNVQRNRMAGRAAAGTAQSRINSVQRGKRPSLLALGAQLGQAAVGGYQMRSTLRANEAARQAAIS